MIWRGLKVGSDSSLPLLYLKNNALPLWPSLFYSHLYDLIHCRDDIIMNMHAQFQEHKRYLTGGNFDHPHPRVKTPKHINTATSISYCAFLFPCLSNQPSVHKSTSASPLIFQAPMRSPKEFSPALWTFNSFLNDLLAVWPLNDHANSNVLPIRGSGSLITKVPSRWGLPSLHP